MRALARRDGAFGLGRALLLVSLCPLAYYPLLLTNEPTLVALVHTCSLVAIGVLILRLRGRAVPYGKRLARSVA